MKSTCAQIVIPYLGDNISWNGLGGKKTTNNQIQLLIRNLIVMQPPEWNNILFCVPLGGTRCQVFSIHPQLSDVSQPFLHKAPSSLISYQYGNMYRYIRDGIKMIPLERVPWHHRCYSTTGCTWNRKSWPFPRHPSAVHSPTSERGPSIRRCSPWMNKLMKVAVCGCSGRVFSLIVLNLVKPQLCDLLNEGCRFNFSLIVFTLSRRSLPLDTFPTVNQHGKKY